MLWPYILPKTIELNASDITIKKHTVSSYECHYLKKYFEKLLPKYDINMNTTFWYCHFNFDKKE